MPREPKYYNKREPNMRLKKQYRYQTYKFNEVYIALLAIDFIPGGYSAWGETREDAIHNAMALAGDNIKL